MVKIRKTFWKEQITNFIRKNICCRPCYFITRNLDCLRHIFRKVNTNRHDTTLWNTLKKHNYVEVFFHFRLQLHPERPRRNIHSPMSRYKRVRFKTFSMNLIFMSRCYSLRNIFVYLYNFQEAYVCLPIPQQAFFVKNERPQIHFRHIFFLLLFFTECLWHRHDR